MADITNFPSSKRRKLSAILSKKAGTLNQNGITYPKSNSGKLDIRKYFNTKGSDTLQDRLPNGISRKHDSPSKVDENSIASQTEKLPLYQSQVTSPKVNEKTLNGYHSSSGEVKVLARKHHNSNSSTGKKSNNDLIIPLSISNKNSTALNSNVSSSSFMRCDYNFSSNSPLKVNGCELKPLITRISCNELPSTGRSPSKKITDGEKGKQK